MKLIGKELSGHYKITELMDEGGMGLIFKATDTKGKREVAVKVLKEAASGGLEDIIRFRREANIVSKLSHPSLIEIYEVGEYQGMSYIVMELLEGQLLRQILKSKQAVALKDALKIITEIAEVLDNVHNSGVIHRDLKPGNIMIFKNDGELSLKVLDFGLAQAMELSKIADADEVVGTFSYMSPEQSGIIKKVADERSDLYSLGIIFYELLTGELPFKGEDVRTILHQQVARQPEFPNQQGMEIPKLLEKMVLKLLKKDPEERYQTAKGLLADLNRFINGESEFVLGKEDAFRKITYRTRLVGRKEELLKLKELYHGASKGKGSVCFIEGEPGIGKSRLAEELRSYAYELGGEFIEGKCLAQVNKLPFQPFVEALNEYLSRTEKLSPLERQIRVDRMRESLGDLGEIICSLNPAVRGTLGGFPTLVPLDPERENKRFLMVCAKFFEELGQMDRPVVIFLDDMHYADDGSLALLNEIVQDISKFPLLIVGTFVKSEAEVNCNLIKVISEAKNKNYPIEKLNLENLEASENGSMVAELLLEDSKKVFDLSQYILKKTKGNPYFTIEIVRQLVDEKILAYSDGSWTTDWDKLNQISISNSLVDIIVKRVEHLEEEQVKVLSVAAALGSKFKLDMIYSLGSRKKDELVGIIDEAVNLNLIEEGREKGEFLFVHDRVREIFYSKLYKEERQKLHLKIAKRLEEFYKDNAETFVFDLAHHYIEAGDKSKALEYSLPAAEKAKAGYANDEALRYYSVVIRLLEEEGQKESLKWIKAKEGLAFVYLTVGKNDEAIESALETINLKETPLEKAKVYRQIGLAYFKKGDWANCADNIINGIALIGEKAPRTKAKTILYLVKELFTHLLYKPFSKRYLYVEKKDVTPEYIEILWGYLVLGWSYVLSDVEKFTHTVLRMLNISKMEIGKSKELGLCLGSYAVLLAAIPFYKSAQKHANLSIDMRAELKDEWGVAQSYQWAGYCYQWEGDYLKSAELFQKSVDMFRRMGDLWELGMSLNGLGISYYYLAEYDRADESYIEYLDISKKLEDYFGIGSVSGNISLIHAEKGEFEEAEKISSEMVVDQEKRKIWLCTCENYIVLGYVEIEKGNFDKAVEYLLKAKRLDKEYKLLKEYTVDIYHYLAEAYIGKYLNSGPEEREKTYKDMKKACSVALKQAKSWPNHFGGALRVNGQFYAILNKNKKAENFFVKSIEYCRNLNRRFELARSLYKYGEFLDFQRRVSEASKIYHESYEIFNQFGNKQYVQKLQKILGIEELEIESAQERLTEKIGLDSIISVSHHLSSILDINELLEKIMDVSIEVSGAERGFLLLYPQGENTERTLEVKVSRNVEKDSFKKDEYAISSTVIKRVEESKEGIIVVDAAGDDGLKTQASVVKYGLRSVLCVPLLARDKLLGVVYVDNRLVGGLFSGEKLELLKTLLTQAAISIENARLYNEVQEKARMEEELRLGREIQANLLPQEVPVIEGIMVSGTSMSAKEVGGDYYDFIVERTGSESTVQNKLGIIIGDVSGKGVGAGLIMAAAKATLHSLAHQRLGPREVLIRANDVLLEYTQGQKFITMLYFEWDPVNKKMKYSSAGHERILIYRKAEGTVEVIKSGGFILGVISDVSEILKEKELELSSGDKVVLYTDGVTEAKNDKGESFSLERLVKTVEIIGEKSPDVIMGTIKQKVYDFIGNQIQYDDITIVTMEIV